MKNILITGALGQLGSEIQRIADNYKTKYQFYFTDKDDLDITNLNELKKFVADKEIHYIINCAAYTAVDKAEDDLKLCYLINRDAAINLGTIATKYRAKLIHVSTDYVFDGNGTKPYLESDTTSPKSAYGQSKLEGELGLEEACHEAIIIRTAWLYSLYRNNFVKTMIRLGKERDTLNVVADQKGTPTNAADLALTIMQIIDYTEKQNKFYAGVYHFTNEGETTWYEFTKTIHKIAGITCDVKPITTAEYPTRASRPAYSVLSKDKIKSTFGITIPEWKESLAKCIEVLNKQ